MTPTVRSNLAATLPSISANPRRDAALLRVGHALFGSGAVRSGNGEARVNEEVKSSGTVIQIFSFFRMDPINNRLHGFTQIHNILQESFFDTS
jgi:hypothetical protein